MSASGEPNSSQAGSCSLSRFLSEHSGSSLTLDVRCTSSLCPLHHRGSSMRASIAFARAITSQPRPGVGLACRTCRTTPSCIQALNTCVSDDSFLPGFSSRRCLLCPLRFPLGSEFRGSRREFTVCPWDRTLTSLALAGTAGPTLEAGVSLLGRSALPRCRQEVAQTGPSQLHTILSPTFCAHSLQASSSPCTKALKVHKATFQCFALAWHSKPPVINPQTTTSGLFE